MIIPFLFVFLITISDTTATPPQQTDLTPIWMMVLEGNTPGAIERLENLKTEASATQEALVLLLNLYQQEFRHPESIALYERQAARLDRVEEAVIAYAQAKLQMGYRNDAKNALENLRIKDMAGMKALVLLGKMYYDGREWKEALNVYEEITEVLPNNLLFKTQKARVHTMLREEGESRRILEDVLNRQSDFIPAMLQLTSLYYSLNEKEEARKIAERGIELYPEETRFYTMAGRVAYSDALYEKATEHWNTVVKLGDANSETFRGLGLCYYELGMAKEAISNFNNALAFNPDDTIALMYSAMVHRREGEWWRVKQLLDRLYTLHTGEYLRDVMMQRATAHEELQNISAAEEDYKRVMSVFPDHKEAEFYLAALYDRHMDDRNLALRYYRSYLTHSEEDPELVLYAIGRVQYLVEAMHFEQGREQPEQE